MCVQDYEDDFDDDAESSGEDSETPEPAVKKPSSKRVRFVPAWVLLSPVMPVQEFDWSMDRGIEYACAFVLE